MAHEKLVAVRERARHLPVEDQEIGDEPGLDALPVDPMVGGERRDLAQDGRPLEVVEAAADPLGLGQQQMVLHVEDAGGVVGALDRQRRAG